MSLPRPELGLVIRYAYLWLREHKEGKEDVVKDRPCALVFMAHQDNGITKVTVLPVTHSAPVDSNCALEIPPAIKHMLGLDTACSWVVLNESNRFNWPGPDLRRVGEGDNSTVAFGHLPPRFFAELQRRFLQLKDGARSRRVERTN